MEKRNLILLDIDDCIFPNNGTWFGRTDDDFDLLLINLKRLAMICKMWKLEIIIISSMASSLSHNDKTGLVQHRMTKRYNRDEHSAVDMMNEHISKYVTGLSCGNKICDIKNAIRDPSVHNVIVIEDTNYSHLVNPNNNSYWIETHGYISGKIGGQIKKIMEPEWKI